MAVTWVGTAGDVVSAATAMGGLLLVFIGAISAGFGSYDATQQKAVRKRYLIKATLALVGFFLALISAALGLAGKLTENQCLVIGAVSCLGASLVVVFIAGLLSVWEMV